MMKNKIVLFAMVLLLSTAVCIKPAFADEVYIEVDMDGDAYVYIENTDGELTLIYNGRDILAELEAYYNQLLALQSQIAYLQGRADVDDLRGDFTELYIQVGLLIEELEAILKDLYGNLGFLAHVIGINPGDNSTIVEMLVSGNATIVDYLDEAFTYLDGLDTEIVSFQDYTQQQLNTTYTELKNFEEYTQEQLNAMDLDETAYRKYIDGRVLELNSMILAEAQYRGTVDDHLRVTQESLLNTQYALYSSVGFSVVLAIALLYVVKKR